MPVTERIVIDADPSIKKMLSEISEEYNRTMKDIVCSLIESKYKELQLRKQEEKSVYQLNLSLEDLKTRLN
ncbi:hypothetical protein ACS78_18305 [Priestia megaterium]|uniref:hypothetical protein n=1 Tax=Priestia megaterium TaxID=1404 RepID=UPI0006831D3B|nr:hypothetical protein [Priestia megaterium]KNH20159.1 hypothetical protein ACS78_18305 [Priestia megaterium]